MLLPPTSRNNPLSQFANARHKIVNHGGKEPNGPIDGSSHTNPPNPPSDRSTAGSSVHTVSSASHKPSYSETQSYEMSNSKQPIDPTRQLTPSNQTQNSFAQSQHAPSTDFEKQAKSLEKSMNFLKNQHSEILASLIDEVEDLKLKNKNLQFQLVQAQERNASTGSPDFSLPPPGTNNLIAYKSHTNNVQQNPTSNGPKDNLVAENQALLREVSRLNKLVARKEVKSSGKNTATKRGAAVSNNSTDQSTIAEIHVKMQQLQIANKQQEQEIIQLRNELRISSPSNNNKSNTVVRQPSGRLPAMNGRGTANAASALLSNGAQNAGKMTEYRSRLLPAIDQTTNHGAMDGDNHGGGSVFPALTQAVGNRAVERKKKIEVLHKVRSRQPLPPQQLRS